MYPYIKLQSVYTYLLILRRREFDVVNNDIVNDRLPVPAGHFLLPSIMGVLLALTQP